MKEIDKFSKQINQLTYPVRQLSKISNKIVANIVEPLTEIAETFEPVFKDINKIAKAFEPYLSQFDKVAQQIYKRAKKWQAEKKQDVVLMAENGWYPNWLTFFYTPSVELRTIDELMIMHLNENWDDITSMILKFCPKRRHILKNAFCLHESGNYIAAMPLFLSQADGICCESIVNSFLFTENKVEENIDKLIESGQVKTDMFVEVFLEPFKIKNYHRVGISKNSASAKAKAPSRSGILHGHRKHLDYGTEKNSLKCFSLLSFVVYTTKDLMQEKP